MEKIYFSLNIFRRKRRDLGKHVNNGIARCNTKNWQLCSKGIKKYVITTFCSDKYF